MGLNDIKLPNATIAALYSSLLVEEKKTIESKALGLIEPLSTLGNNKKNISILINNTDAIHLPDDELKLLLNILSACKLNMDDVAIINLDKDQSVTYHTIAQSLSASVVLMFGVNANAIELPIELSLFQIQAFNNQTYLLSTSLKDIEQDKMLKGKLWNCLKQIFSI